VRCLVPGDYAAAAGLLAGGAAYLAALSMLPRYGWPFSWPLGRLAAGWYVAAGALLLAAVAAQLWLGLRWRRQLRGHGVAWTRQWAAGKPYAARRLALRALRYMGEGDVQ
jgi:hypothetical protein